MAQKRLASTLHLLSSREVQTAGEGDHSDGGGLLLRVRGESASRVFRFTAQTGRRREMGLGVARRANPSQAGDSVATARKLAREARDLLSLGVDPLMVLRPGSASDVRRTAAVRSAELALPTPTRRAMPPA